MPDVNLPAPDKASPEYVNGQSKFRAAELVGALTGLVGALLIIWIPAIYADTHATGPGAVAMLGALVVGTPLACLAGPIAGFLGSMVGSNIARQSGRSALVFWLFNAGGGCLAGVGVVMITIGLFFLCYTFNSTF